MTTESSGAVPASPNVRETDPGDDAAPGEPMSTAGDEPTPSARWAAATFALYVTVAFFVLVHFGRHYWFYQDDWGLLVRNVGSVEGLFRPQNGHWSTMPLLAYHVLYSAFGLNYHPYQLCTIVMSLALASVLRLLMRRAGVSPWLATLTAAVFVMFGPGRENIMLAVQISMVGSLLFGIGHLLCADHDGPFGRRDALGLLLGALGLMASGIGVVMVVIVGIAVLVRRGWRMAALHTAPLAALYVVWYEVERNWFDVPSQGSPVKHALDWTTAGERHVFMALGNYRPVAVALAVLLVAGLVVAWRPLGLAEFRRRASVPLAMLLGAPVLFTAVSTQRYVFGNQSGASHYVSMATAFTLPALAVAADGIARRWRFVTPLVVLLVVSAIPANIGKFGIPFPGAAFYENEKATMLGLAYSPLAAHVPRDLRPHTEIPTAPYVTIGYLLDARAHGKLPPPPILTPAKQDEIVVRLAVEQPGATDDILHPIDIAPSRPVKCHRYTTTLVLHPANGVQFVINQPVSISYRSPGASFAQGGVTFSPRMGRLLVVQVPGLELHVDAPPLLFARHSPPRPFTFCT